MPFTHRQGRRSSWRSRLLAALTMLVAAAGMSAGTAQAVTYNYTGPVVPIPPGTGTAGPGAPATATATVNVSGAGTLDDIDFRSDGSACTTDAGATTVGLDHTYVGDLVISLTSPEGTTVTLIDRPGVPPSTFGNSGNNFCQTLLDDGASTPIETQPNSAAPFTGTFQPNNPLAAFNGEDPNGTWTLTATDFALSDIGSIRAFSLITTEAEPVPPGCTITGTSGNDTLTGTNGADVICGLGGNDTINGANGDDTIYGGSGDDIGVSCRLVGDSRAAMTG